MSGAEAPSEKMVPEKDLMAVKAAREKAEASLKELQTQHETLKQQVQQKGAEVNIGTEDVESLRQVKAQLAQKAVEIEEEKRKLAEEKKAHTEAKLKAEVDSLVSKYGLSPEEIKDLTPKDIELVGLKKKVETLEKGVPSATRKDVDVAQPSGNRGEPLSGLELAHREIEEYEKKKKR